MNKTVKTELEQMFLHDQQQKMWEILKTKDPKPLHTRVSRPYTIQGPLWTVSISRES